MLFCFIVLEKYEIFNEIEMFDDGNHNDGANDGLYGCKLKILVIQLIITFMLKMILQVCFHLKGQPMNI